MKSTTRTLATALVLGLLVTVSAQADVPTRMNVSGRLADTDGNAATPGPKGFTFKIYSSEFGGTEIWPAGPGEDQTITTDLNGLWNAYVGVFTPLTHSAFQNTSRWLEITVDDGVNPPETLPRTRLVTTPFAYRVATVDGADGGMVIGDLDVAGKATIGTGHSNAGTDGFVAGRNHTTSGNEPTVGGGFNNESDSHSTVSGGANNRASGTKATVGGGSSNTASGTGSTIGGGTGNTTNAAAGGTIGGGTNNRTGLRATVSGGEDNVASGTHSAVPGGLENTAGGDYSLAAGRRAKANHAGAFVWADQTDADFFTSGDDQFLIRASGGVGIGTNTPTAKLHVGGTPGVDGIRFPDGSLQTTAAAGGGSGGWTDDGTAVRLETSSDSVGIGTSSPQEKLDVNGTTRMQGFELPTGATNGYVLTSDGGGAGSWQTVSSSSISDEPGISTNIDGTGATLPINTWNVISTSTITVPASGYVVATASVEVAAAVSGTLTLGISNRSDLIKPDDNAYGSSFLAGFGLPLTQHAVFSVSAGDTTFYYIARPSNSNFWYRRARLTLIYVPTAHGPIDLVAGTSAQNTGVNTEQILNRSEIPSTRLGVPEPAVSDDGYYESEMADLRARMTTLERELEIARRTNLDPKKEQ